MKSESYNAIAGLNRGFDAVMESLGILQQAELLTAEYVQDHTTLAEEMRAGVNHMILEKLLGREEEDWVHFGKLRVTIEERNKHEATTTPADSGPDASGENGQRAQDGSESPKGNDTEGRG